MKREHLQVCKTGCKIIVETSGRDRCTDGGKKCGKFRKQKGGGTHKRYPQMCKRKKKVTENNRRRRKRRKSRQLWVRKVKKGKRRGRSTEVWGTNVGP